MKATAPRFTRCLPTVLFVLALCLGLSPSPALATTVIDDTFDDGDIATNTTRIGAGFTYTMEIGNDGGNLAGCYVSESDESDPDSLATVFASDPGSDSGWQNIVTITSNDTAMADGLLATFYASADTNEPSNRVRFGVTGTDGVDSFGLIVSLYGRDSVPKYRNSIRLEATDTDSHANLLSGTPNHGLNWTNDFVVGIAIDSLGYSVSLSDGTGPSGDPLYTGEWGVGSASSITFNDVPMATVAVAQANRDGSAKLVLDSITLSTPNDSVITGPATLDLGTALVGATPSRPALLDKTGASATTYTATPDNADALDVIASGTFGEGPQDEDVTVALTGHNDGSGISGYKEFTVTVDNLGNDGDPDDNIVVSADVYQPLSLVADTIANGLDDDLYLENELSDDGGQRAAALMVDGVLTGDTTHWSVSGFTPDTPIAEGENPLVATASFDASGLLGHDTRTYDATYTVTSEYEDGDIDLGGAQSSFESVWDLSRTVTVDEVVIGEGTVVSAVLGEGEDLAGYGATSTNGTVAKLLDGVAGTGGRDVSMSFTTNSDPYVIGDLVVLTGLEPGDVFVLQVKYNETDLLAHLAARGLAADETLASLLMMTPTGSRLAVAVGSDAGQYVSVVGAYDHDLHFTPGYYGVDPDNDVVWAVLDHNSEFGAGVTPEPAGLMLAGLALLGLRKRRS